jgi:hypothetical protein
MARLRRAPYHKPVPTSLPFALASVGRSPDFLIFVEREGHEGSVILAEEIDAYLARRKPQDAADFRLTWSCDGGRTVA